MLASCQCATTLFPAFSKRIKHNYQIGTIILKLTQNGVREGCDKEENVGRSLPLGKEDKCQLPNLAGLPFKAFFHQVSLIVGQAPERWWRVAPACTGQ